METLILRPKKSKAICLFFGTLVFVAVGIWLLKSDNVTGWFATIMFGICALVFTLQMLPDFSFLQLDKDGFTEAICFRTRKILWQEIDRFAVCYGAVIYENNSNEIVLSKTGGDGCLSGTYGLSAEELVVLLNEWKKKSQKLT